MDKFTIKQKLFCSHYIVDFNGTQAALKAGYSKKSAYRIASKLINKPHIKKYIEEKVEEKMKRLDVTADDVRKELIRIGFSNIGNFLEMEGERVTIKNPCTMDKDELKVIKTLKMKEKNGKLNIHLTLHSKLEALDKLMKHYFTLKNHIQEFNDTRLKDIKVEIMEHRECLTCPVKNQTGM